MIFSSALFLFLFFPVVVGGYFLVDKKLRNTWLLVTSLVFYSWGEPKYILLMFTSIAVNYFMAIGIGRMSPPPPEKAGPEFYCCGQI